MPVLDAKGQYDILLGQDWLSAVKAVGYYNDRRYVIKNREGEDVSLGETAAVDNEERELDSLVTQILMSCRAEFIDLALERAGYSTYFDYEDEKATKVVDARVAFTGKPVSEAETAFTERFGLVETGALKKPEREELFKVLEEHSSCFVGKDSPKYVEPTTLLTARVCRLEGERPFYETRQRRADPKEVDGWKSLLPLLESKGFVRPWDENDQVQADASGEHWRSHARLIPKPHGRGWRLVVNLIALNERTVSVPQEVFDLFESIEKIAGRKVSSALDMDSAFFLIPVDERDQIFFRVHTPLGDYVLTRMPQGWKNSPGLLFRLVRLVFKEILHDPRFAVYMDDVGMSDDSFVSMLALLKEVLACARNGKVLFSAHKLQLCMDKITWGGVEISSEGHTIDKDRVERIHRIAEPLISVQEVRMFLQMVTWNARYVLMLADALVPLTSLLKK